MDTQYTTHHDVPFPSFRQDAGIQYQGGKPSPDFSQGRVARPLKVV